MGEVEEDYQCNGLATIVVLAALGIFALSYRWSNRQNRRVFGSALVPLVSMVDSVGASDIIHCTYVTGISWFVFFVSLIISIAMCVLRTRSRRIVCAIVPLATSFGVAEAGSEVHNEDIVSYGCLIFGIVMSVSLFLNELALFNKPARHLDTINMIPIDEVKDIRRSWYQRFDTKNFTRCDLPYYHEFLAEWRWENREVRRRNWRTALDNISKLTGAFDYFEHDLEENVWEYFRHTRIQGEAKNRVCYYYPNRNDVAKIVMQGATTIIHNWRDGNSFLGTMFPEVKFEYVSYQGEPKANHKMRPDVEPYVPRKVVLREMEEKEGLAKDFASFLQNARFDVFLKSIKPTTAFKSKSMLAEIVGMAVASLVKEDDKKLKTRMYHSSLECLSSDALSESISYTHGQIFENHPELSENLSLSIKRILETKDSNDDTESSNGETTDDEDLEHSEELTNDVSGGPDNRLDVFVGLSSSHGSGKSIETTPEDESEIFVRDDKNAENNTSPIEGKTDINEPSTSKGGTQCPPNISEDLKSETGILKIMKENISSPKTIKEVSNNIKRPVGKRRPNKGLRAREKRKNCKDMEREPFKKPPKALSRNMMTVSQQRHAAETRIYKEIDQSQRYNQTHNC